MLITVTLKFDLVVELPGEFTKYRFLSPTSSVSDSVGWSEVPRICILKFPRGI